MTTIIDFIEVSAKPTEEEYTGNSVSYNQYKIYSTCPKQWQVTYVDGNRVASDSIDTVFGTSMHNVIQTWLGTYFIDEKKARQVDLDGIFKDEFMKNFKKSELYNNLEYTAVMFQEYYDDGCAILSHVQKYAKEFFPTKGYRLIGCEVPLKVDFKIGLRFKGFIDIVIHDMQKNQYHIIDLKTSKSGWYDYKKKDSKVINQIILYKKFYSELFNVEIEDIFPRFIILKRKITEHPDFIIRRLSKFEPSHGKISMKKATESWNEFINECFDDQGQYRDKQHKAVPSESNCKYCPFNDNESLCTESWYLKRKQAKERNRGDRNDE